MAVCVIIPTFNGGSMLRRCLDSLRELPSKPDRVVVVDNGSTDGTQEGVRRDYPEAILIPLERNTGFTGATNAGFEASQGDLIVLLNNDCEVEPHWLSALTRRMEDPSVGAVASSLRNIRDVSIMDSAGGRIDWLGFSRDIGKGEPASSHARPADIAYPCGGGVMIRRKALPDPSRLFWNALFAYNEDMDLGLELWRTGWRVVYEPSATARHVHSATAGRGSPFVEYHCTRNRLLVMRKHLAQEMFRALLPGILQWQRLWIVSRIARGRFSGARAVLRGTRDGLGMPVERFQAPVPCEEVFCRFAVTDPGVGTVKTALYRKAERILRAHLPTAPEEGSSP